MAEHLEVWLIILLVIGVIASNLAVLKYSSKFKMPQFGQQQKSVNDAEKAPASSCSTEADEVPTDNQTDGTRNSKPR